MKTRTIQRLPSPVAPRLFERACAPTPRGEQLALLVAFVASLTPIAVLAAAALPR